MVNPFRAKPLTRARIATAMAVAVLADAVQIAAGPLGWVGFVQVVDVIAMIITSLLIGFHPLLLPTFIIELVPIVDMVPTWTGCVGAVLLLRKRSEPSAPPVVNTAPDAPAEPPPKRMADSAGPVIDV